MKILSRKHLFTFLAALFLTPLAAPHAAERLSLSAVHSPVIFRGDATTAFRDPAAIYHEGWFRLFFTVVKTDADGKPYARTAWSKSRDLISWSEPVPFTPRDPSLNFCSPGNIVRYGDEWVLCLCTYPRPNGENTATPTRGYGRGEARISKPGANRNCYESKARTCPAKNGPND